MTGRTARSLLGRLAAGAAAALLCLGAAAPASAGGAAVVIVNADYRKLAPVDAPGYAARVAGALREAGFETVVEENASIGEMLAALRFLRQKSGEADAVVVYFVGYARQLNGTNFLLPVQADPRGAFDLLTQGMDLTSVRAAMREAGDRLRIVVIDGAWPEARLDAITGLGPGLAAMDAEPGEAVLLGVEAGTLTGTEASVGELATAFAEALASGQTVTDILATASAEAARSRGRGALVPVAIGTDLPRELLPSPEAEPAGAEAPPAGPATAAPATSGDPAAEVPTAEVPRAGVPTAEVPTAGIPAAEPVAAADPAAGVAPDPASGPASGPMRMTAPGAGAGGSGAPPAEAERPRAALDGPGFEASLEREERFRIQQALGNIGVYRAGVDGIFGPRTREAIVIFQRLRGFEPTGYLTEAQMLALFEVGGV